MANWPFMIAGNNVGMPSPYANSEPQYVPYDTWLRSSNETGPQKLRRRFTGKMEKLSFVLVLSDSQRATLMTFYETTVKEVLPFDWIDLRTGAAQVYRFNKRPSDTWFGSDGAGVNFWQMVIDLDTVP